MIYFHEIHLIITNLGQISSCQLAHQSAQLGQQNVQLEQLVQQKAQLVSIQEQLGQLLVASGLRRRGSVASLHSIASFAHSIGQKEAWKGAWKELSRELHRNGITADMIKAKKEEICQLFRTATIHSFSGKPNEEGVPQRSEANEEARKVDRAVFDSIIETLSTPARRARYLVTRLVDDRISLDDAAAQGRTDIVKMLLNRGEPIDAPDYNTHSALYRATENGHVEVVKVLLDRGASMDATTHDGSTTLHVAAESGHSKVVKVLDRGASIDATTDGGSTALYLAACFGHIEVMKVLLDRGASIDNATTQGGSTALQEAARSGYIEVVKVLLDRGASTDDATTHGGSAALPLAAYFGHVEIVKVLLDRGANIDARTPSGWAVLDELEEGWTVRIGPVEVKTRRRTSDNMYASQWTALHLAVAKGHTRIIRMLLDRGASIDATTDDGHGSTALHLAVLPRVARYGRAGVVGLLLENGAKTDLRNGDGETALDIACRLGREHEIKVLTVHIAKISALVPLAIQPLADRQVAAHDAGRNI